MSAETGFLIVSGAFVLWAFIHGQRHQVLNDRIARLEEKLRGTP